MANRFGDACLPGLPSGLLPNLGDHDLYSTRLADQPVRHLVIVRLSGVGKIYLPAHLLFYEFQEVSPLIYPE